MLATTLNLTVVSFDESLRLPPVGEDRTPLSKQGLIESLYGLKFCQPDSYTVVRVFTSEEDKTILVIPETYFTL